ncbi:hypothetical protein [Janibacter sp. GXQ6167]|uniref:hypothetical protein n=1 Tax=Janibacter sp. GXQ6167 TaxID=3240791 RepID=UPI003525A32C
MKKRREPKILSFLLTGAIIGFVVFGLVAILNPELENQWGATYSATTAVGYMSVFGMLLGAICGAVAAAIAAGPGDPSQRRRRKRKGD